MSPNEPKQQPSSSQPPLTIREVAEHAGVSTATVSRVLSGQMVVSQELTERVQSAVKDLQYRPNRTTRRHRKLPSQMIGLIAADIQSPLFHGMIQDITTVLDEANCTLVICDSGNDPQRERVHLNTLRAEGVAGILLASSDSDTEDMRMFLRVGPPVVAVERRLTRVSVDTVRVDNAATTRYAVDQLLAAGRKRIALLDQPALTSVVQERREGYRAALEAAQTSVADEYVQLVRVDETREAVERLLALKPAPDALLIGAARMALDALCVLRERGVGTPQEVALVCFEPLPACFEPYLPIQVIAPPPGETGATATRMLLERIANPRMPARDVVV